MADIKAKFHINKLTVKNLLLLFLLMIVIAVIGVITKVIKPQSSIINTAEAQCWTTPSGGGSSGSEGGSEGCSGSSGSASCEGGTCECGSDGSIG